MTQPRVHMSGRVLRTPRAAAIAGILFALLYGTGYFLIQLRLPEVSPDSNESVREVIETISLGLSLLPFAGIAFLWFIGVVRDRLGHLEDQFFSTLFFGSGLLYLGLTFTSAAIAGGLLSVYALEPEVFVEPDLYLAVRGISNRITTVYSIRMAGMFMFVLGTIWLRTGVLPRLLALLTSALALVLLIGIGFSHWVSLVFPTWVFLISVVILIANYRAKDTRADSGSAAGE